MVTDGARPREAPIVLVFEGTVTWRVGEKPGLKEASSLHSPGLDSYCVASDRILSPRAIPPAPVAPGPDGEGARARLALLYALCG